VIDTQSGAELRRIHVSDEPEGLTVQPATGRIYVACEEKGGIFAIDLQQPNPLLHFTVPGRPRLMAFGPDSSIYIPLESNGKVLIANAETGKQTGEIPLGETTKPMGTAMSPDNNNLYVSTGWGNSINHRPSLKQAHRRRSSRHACLGYRPKSRWNPPLHCERRQQ
jgi:DNA-binding beta-propeller fold protein YncE